MITSDEIEIMNALRKSDKMIKKSRKKIQKINNKIRMNDSAVNCMLEEIPDIISQKSSFEDETEDWK